MNKKVLSAILFSALFAGTGTFTSCIDNEEPAGIEELRGAKAELLRAKVAVEQAKATFTLAQAEVEKAKAAKELAEAKIKEATAKLEEAKAEAQEIKNEEARVELETLIAKYEMELEKAAADHELSMVKKQQALAEAKRTYDIAMKQIAIAEALMSESQKVAVSTIKAQINTLMGQVAMVEDAIEAKQEELYHAALYLGAETDYQIAYAEQQLSVAEGNLEANAAAIAKYKKYMDNESEGADWREEVAAIEAEVAEYDKQIAVLKLEKTKAEESDECKALTAALKAEQDTLAAANKARTDLALGAEVAYTYKYWNGEKNFKESLAKGMDIDEAGELIAGPDFMDADAEVAGIIEKVGHVYAGYTEEYKAYLKKVAAADVTNGLAAAKKASDDAVAAWTTALTAYNTAVSTAKDLSRDAAKAAVEAYEEDLAEVAAMTKKTGETDEEFAGRKYYAKMKAKQTFADAMVAFYASLPADQAPLNKLTLKIETSINGLEKTDYITKTAKEWLSDSNKELYLDILIDQIFYKGGTPGNRIPDFEAFYKDGAEREITIGEDKYTTAWVALGGWKSKATLVAEKKATLVAKSTAAFGTALLSVNGKTFEYLSVMPSEADVKLVGYANAGAYGQYLGYTDTDLVFVAKNYEAILADYTAAIEFWTAELAKVKASIVAANNAIKVANADVTAATKAKNKFVAAYTAEYNNAVAALNAKVQSLNAVKNALINAVDVYLAENYSGEENFMDWLANQVKSLEANVINLNKQVAIAEANLKAAEEGHFLTADNVARIQSELADLEEKLAGIVAQLEEAVAALATAQEIWAE